MITSLQSIISIFLFLQFENSCIIYLAISGCDDMNKEQENRAIAEIAEEINGDPDC